MSASFTNKDSESQNRAKGNPSRFNALEKRSNWENHLRESQDGINGIQMQIPYLSSYSIFVCISIVSTVVGILINRQAFQGSWEAITWIASAIVLVFNLGLVGLVATRFR